LIALRRRYQITVSRPIANEKNVVPNFPDPGASPQHPERPTFNLQPVNIDPNSPQIGAKIHLCEPLLRDSANLQNLGLGGSRVGWVRAAEDPEFQRPERMVQGGSRTLLNSRG
jgi:hypothetical protein